MDDTQKSTTDGMKITVLGESNSESAAFLNQKDLTLTFEDNRYKEGIIGYTIMQYDLKQMCGLQLLYEFPDYEKRRQEAERKTEDNRASNTILGAVIGGVVDAVVGDNDSILDGALIGGVAGYAMASVEQINLKEQTDHFINLLFRDGGSVTVKVDAALLAILLRVLHKVKTQYAKDPAKPSVQHIQLSNKMLEEAHLAARSSFTEDVRAGGHLSLLFGTFFTLIILILTLTKLEGLTTKDLILWVSCAAIPLLIGIAVKWTRRSKEIQKIKDAELNGDLLPKDVSVFKG